MVGRESQEVWSAQEVTTKKQNLIDSTNDVISQYTTRLTLRQIFYRLVSRQIVANTMYEYKYLSKCLAEARMQGLLPFSAIEDRTRNSTGGGNRYETSVENVFETAVSDYLAAIEEAKSGKHLKNTSYSLPKWFGQPNYIEVWLEKDALSRMFEEITLPYHIKLVTSKGYPSLTYLVENIQSLRATLQEYDEIETCHILYFGDYDPSGRDISRHIKKTMRQFGVEPEFSIVAITLEQITHYKIPPLPTKKSDPRTKKWLETHGDIAVELDAIDPNELQLIIRKNIEDLFDDRQFDIKEQLAKKRQQKLKTKIEEYLNQGADD